MGENFQSQKKVRVALGLSGGVDSAVAAIKLLEAGYEVIGVYMECYREEGCRSDMDRKDALAVALKLGIEFVSLDFRKPYQERVLSYFYDEYAAGRTPNPDVLCNREIKFGLFWEWGVGEMGYDYIATGHYCRKIGLSQRISGFETAFVGQSCTGVHSFPPHLLKARNPLTQTDSLNKENQDCKFQNPMVQADFVLEDGSLDDVLGCEADFVVADEGECGDFNFRGKKKKKKRKSDWQLPGFDFVEEIVQTEYLAVAVDEWKDQTYFLNQIGADKLKSVLFPLGEMKKSEVRAMAAEHGLEMVANKKDSVGVCFVGDINVREFLMKNYLKGRDVEDGGVELGGLIFDQAAQLIGTHQGAWLYTIGQRHGLKIDVKCTDSRPYFVIGKNMERNELIVGFEEDLYRDRLKIKEINWLIEDEISLDYLEKAVVENRLLVRIRHTGEMIKVMAVSEFEFKNDNLNTPLAQFEDEKDISLKQKNKKLNNLSIALEKSVKGVSEGQFAVFYEVIEEENIKICLGGGILLEN